jgi:hypothetical protein
VFYLRHVFEQPAHLSALDHRAPLPIAEPLTRRAEIQHRLDLIKTGSPPL